jgi:hypothetical protein
MREQVLRLLRRRLGCLCLGDLHGLKGGSSVLLLREGPPGRAAACGGQRLWMIGGRRGKREGADERLRDCGERVGEED